MVLKLKNIRLWLLPVAGLVLLSAAPAVAGPAATNSWSLTSPDGVCSIAVALGSNGSLSYQATRAGKIVVPASPLGLRRDDQDFEQSLQLDHAGEVEGRRGKYELL